MLRLPICFGWLVGSRCLQEELVDRVLICDLDVHQGDGTAEILKERQVDVKKQIIISRYALQLSHFEPWVLHIL